MSIFESLQMASPRPSDSAPQSEKKNYAERLSRALATQFARALRPDFSGITPDPSGKRQESPARTAKGFKKLDVNYSTPELGLGLGVSIKTINFRDAKSKRYTKNYTRVDNELRAEATDYHERQPYSVLVAVVFLPVDCCEDGLKGKDTPSSFGQAVRVFRGRSNRRTARDPHELFERIFIGAYIADEPRRGDVWFFDVVNPPPRNGEPREQFRLCFDGLISAVRETYDARNNPPFAWSD